MADVPTTFESFFGKIGNIFDAPEGKAGDQNILSGIVTLGVAAMAAYALARTLISGDDMFSLIFATILAIGILAVAAGTGALTWVSDQLGGLMSGVMGGGDLKVPGADDAAKSIDVADDKKSVVIGVDVAATTVAAPTGNNRQNLTAAQWQQIIALASTSREIAVDARDKTITLTDGNGDGKITVPEAGHDAAIASVKKLAAGSMPL